MKGLRSDGSETAATDGDGRGRRAYFRTTDGGLIPQVTPPPSFDPKKASAQELDSYGYPSRPDESSADRAEWDRVWGAKPPNAGARSAGYCEARDLRGERTKEPNEAGEFQASSHSLTRCSQATAGGTGTPTKCYEARYAGAMGTGGAGKFKKANMGWYQTAYSTQSSTTCPNTVYFTWTGFGGFAGKLMQAGTVSALEATGPTDYSNSAMFWEIINSEVVSPPSYVFTAGDQKALVPGGHETRAYVAFDDPQHPNEAIFTVRDVATGDTRSTGWFSQITYGGNSYPIKDFYDGTKVLFFTEGGDYQRTLRKPYLGNTLIYETTANSTSLTNFPAVNVTNANQTGQNHLQVSTFAHTENDWYNNFEKCI